MMYTIEDMRAAFIAGEDWMALCAALTSGKISKAEWSTGVDFEDFIEGLNQSKEKSND